MLYQSFSRREVRLTLLDAWAGSPPAAAELLRRLGEAGEVSALDQFLTDWEYWCSELLESHISYPVVAYFRSQHQRQSWVAALASGPRRLGAGPRRHRPRAGVARARHVCDCAARRRQSVSSAVQPVPTRRPIACRATTSKGFDDSWRPQVFIPTDHPTPTRASPSCAARTNRMSSASAAR